MSFDVTLLDREFSFVSITGKGLIKQFRLLFQWIYNFMISISRHEMWVWGRVALPSAERQFLVVLNDRRGRSSSVVIPPMACAFCDSDTEREQLGIYLYIYHTRFFSGRRDTLVVTRAPYGGKTYISQFSQCEDILARCLYQFYLVMNVIWKSKWSLQN